MKTLTGKENHEKKKAGGAGLEVSDNSPGDTSSTVLLKKDDQVVRFRNAEIIL